MYREEDFEELEHEERIITDDALAAMILLLGELDSDLEKELRYFYQKYGKDGIVTYQEARKWVDNKDHRKRLTVLLLSVNERFSSLLSKLEPRFESLARAVIYKESEFFEVEDGIDIDELVFAVWGADALNWLDRLRNDANLWQYNINADIKRAILQGKPIDALVADIAARFKSMKSVLNTLGLTESTAIGSVARRAIFKSMGVTQYRFYAKADERTCEYCGGLHTHIFPIAAYEVGSTASPIHPRCRCWEEPILE